MGEVGRLFLFLAVVILITIFMIIVNVQDHADQIQQNTADLQQITKGDILIHHTDHLPTVVNSAVGVEAKENSNRLPFQVCPRFFIISHYAKNVKP